MNRSTFDAKFRASLDSLGSLRQRGDLENFEREVWAEIAVRDSPALEKTPGWLRGALRFRWPVAAPACALVSVACGAILALNRAEVYEAREAAALERSYVASIHPVMRSETLHASTHREP